MMSGSISVDLEPIVTLTVYSDDGLSYDIEAVVDTGFNGYITLTKSQIEAFGLTALDETIVTLADGSTVVLCRYNPSTMVRCDETNHRC